LLALVDLALFSGGRPLQARQIAERQGIPKQYLDQLMMDLKKAGLVLSLRGRQGGYQLARPANTITLWEAIATFGVPIDSGRFLHTRGGRGQTGRKIVKQFWDAACTNSVRPTNSIALPAMFGTTTVWSSLRFDMSAG